MYPPPPPQLSEFSPLPQHTTVNHPCIGTIPCLLLTIPDLDDCSSQLLYGGGGVGFLTLCFFSWLNIAMFLEIDTLGVMA